MAVVNEEFIQKPTREEEEVDWQDWEEEKEEEEEDSIQNRTRARHDSSCSLLLLTAGRVRDSSADWLMPALRLLLLLCKILYRRQKEWQFRARYSK